MSVKEELTLMNSNASADADSSKKERISGSLFVLAAGSLWGLMGLLVRSLDSAGLNSMEITFLRSIITFVCLLIGLLVFDRKALRIRLRDSWCFIGTGALSVAFFNFCYFKTMMLTSLSVAAVLLYTAPTFVMLMSALLFKEKLSAGKAAALVLAFLGCAFASGIVGGAGTLSLTGILYGLGAGFGYALYSIFGRYALQRNYSFVTISFYTFLFASLSTFFLADAEKSFAVITSGTWQLGVKTVLLVLLVTLLPYLSYTKGLKKMENGTASVLASIEPVVATLVGTVIYRESMNVWNVLGICLVLGSIVIINSRDGKLVKNGHKAGSQDTETEREKNGNV